MPFIDQIKSLPPSPPNQKAKPEDGFRLVKVVDSNGEIRFSLTNQKAKPEDGFRLVKVVDSNGEIRFSLK